MAVVLTGTEAEVRREEQEISDIVKTRQAAELLSSRAEDGKCLLQPQRKLKLNTYFAFHTSLCSESAPPRP